MPGQGDPQGLLLASSASRCIALRHHRNSLKFQLIDSIASGSGQLRAINLECIRGDRLLFSGLDLRLGSGEILFIEGANGAGKTSLLRILAGLSQPSEGQVFWGGEGIRSCRAEYHAELIYLGHAAGLKVELSAMENLRVWLKLAGLKVDGQSVRAALRQLGLADYADVPTRALSAGQRQRTSLARLLLSPARLWILDEPFTALDVAGIDRVRGLLEAHARRGGMVALTSHQQVGFSGTVRYLTLN